MLRLIVFGGGGADQRWRHNFLEGENEFVTISEEGRRATFVQSKMRFVHQRPFSFAFGLFTIGDGARTTCKIRVSSKIPLYFGLVAVPIAISPSDLNYYRSQWIDIMSSLKEEVAQDGAVFEMKLDVKMERMEIFLDNGALYASIYMKREMSIDNLVPFVALGPCDPNILAVSIDFVNP